MDISAIDVGAILGVLGAIGKAFHSDSKTKQVEATQKADRDSLDCWRTKVDFTLKAHDQSLQAGNSRFEKSESRFEEFTKTMNEEFKSTNSKLDTLIGYVQNRDREHSSDVIKAVESIKEVLEKKA